MSLKKNFLALVLARPAELAGRTLRHIKTRWIIAKYHQRVPISDFCAEKIVPVVTPRVIAVITHVVSPADTVDPVKSRPKADRLLATIHGILRSLAHCDLKIVINTFRGRHVLDCLPPEIRARVEVEENSEGDPMFIEFLVPDIFLKYQSEHDYFMFLEDDIVILDSWFLNKIERFNGICNDPELLLLPHRYEMNDGQKVYIDLNWREDQKAFSWNRMATFDAEGVKFGECGNSHAAFYCLSKNQLERWEKSGRLLKNQVIIVGPLESAATGCLGESFTTYKPHPDNLNYLEVEHFDDKYSTMILRLQKGQESR